MNLTPGILSYEFGWAPDDERLALATSTDAGYQIRSVNRDGSALTPLADSAGYASDASWSADGTRIVFSALNEGLQQSWVMNPGGSDVRRITLGAEAATLRG